MLVCPKLTPNERLAEAGLPLQMKIGVRNDTTSR